MNEYVFSISGNWQDKLFVGATLGIPYFTYKESYGYIEKDRDESSPYHNLEYQNYLHSEGSGVNFKAGVLYQPFNFLRFGLALHTPTFYTVEDDYESRLAIDHDSAKYNKTVSDGEFEYTLNTPYRVLANAAFIFGNYGFINVDYEMADYSVMRLRSDIYGFRSENNTISQIYTVGHTLRVGGELNLSPIALRAGYGYMSNPYDDKIGKDASHHILSAGLGFRSENNYIDVAYQHTTNTDKDVLYQNAAYSYNVNNISNSVVVTIGCKF
jgi:long-subunit fatty acid transport protein